MELQYWCTCEQNVKMMLVVSYHDGVYMPGDVARALKIKTTIK